jgi:sugar lactone lactonase YvrE
MKSARPLLCLAIALLPFSRAWAAVSPVPAEPLPGALADWQLSPTARPFTIGLESYLDGRKPADVDWRPATAARDGWIDVGRVRPPNREGASKIWARTKVTAAAAGPRPFAVSCRGELALYLNGQLVLRIDHRPADSFRRDAEDTVFLPLIAGDNELALMVTAESPSDWRFQVRDTTAIRQDAQLVPVWEKHEASLGAPESIAYDPKRRVLYVSRFEADGIARLSLDGRTVVPDWCTNVKRPTGLKVHRDRLYVVDRSGVVEIDLETAAILRRTPVAGAAFANDLAIAEDGTIYVTDCFKNTIHRIRDGRSEVWIDRPEVAQPNGILAEAGRLLVGVTADCAIKAVDFATKRITTFARISAGANMDGLVSDGADGYLFSDYYGRLYHADAAGQLQLLLDRRSPRQFIADFEYVPSEHLLIIPSLYDQRITALRWSATPPTQP